MIGMRLQEAKGKFFDPKKITDPAERAQLKMLAKHGAYVRRKAKSMIRRRKRVSSPGEPPSSHSGELRNFIFFFVEKADKNVITGPILLNSKRNNSPPNPSLLEHGGDAVRRRWNAKKREWGEARGVHYEPRPFMAPAQEAVQAQAAEALRGEVR